MSTAVRIPMGGDLIWEGGWDEEHGRILRELGMRMVAA